MNFEKLSNHSLKLAKLIQIMFGLIRIHNMATVECEDFSQQSSNTRYDIDIVKLIDNLQLIHLAAWV